MDRTQGPEDLIKRYLLGELSAEEQTALEDEYFLDRVKYDQLRQAEDDLIDSYARGALAPADRERFEQAYLANPQRRRHVKFSRAFARVMDEELSARSPIERSTGMREIERQHRFFSWWSKLIDMLHGRRSR
jgi:anti-sigma factor RsiW